jgi:hypothetical protein
VNQACQFIDVKSSAIPSTLRSHRRGLEPRREESAPQGAQLTHIAWQPANADLPLLDWLLVGRRFGLIGRGVAWWIGDWLRFGNQRYGEKYARAAAVTGYDVQSLMNMVYVASRFDPPRRRDVLSWSHHAEVAALDEPEQDDWLDLAAEERMSVRALRAELRAARLAATRRSAAKALTSPAAAPEADVSRQRFVCPHCNGEFSPQR